MNIYELTDAYLFLQQLLEDPDTDAQSIVDSMEAIADEIEVKADNYAKVIRNMEGNLAAVKAEQERLAEKKNLLESGIKRLKENLQTAMIQTGKRKFKTDLFSFNIQKNGGAEPVVVDVSTDELPDDCVIITETPNKKVLGEYLKDPELAKYYSRFAHFGERGESLRIK